MNNVEQGSTVTVHYRGILEDGNEFDNSSAREPLNFQVGSGQVIKGFDEAVVGMTPGDKKTFTLSATEAYGERKEEAVQVVEKNRFPEGFTSKVGDQVTGSNELGQQFQALITDIQEETVTMDFNHPLAGKDLTFEIELISVD